jgi:hypothetical protein
LSETGLTRIRGLMVAKGAENSENSENPDSDRKYG